MASEFIGLRCLNDSRLQMREDKIRKISKHNFVALKDRCLCLSLAKRGFTANVMRQVIVLRDDRLKIGSPIDDPSNPSPR